jgi:uncharacterized membrane protein YdbT with pleckstrin-like domain
MSYIDKNLLPDEQLIYRTKKSLIVFVTPFLWTVGAIIFLLNSNPFIIKAAAIFGVIALASWLNTLLLYVTSEFAITDKRVMMKEGFFFRHSNETRLTTIAKVSVTQSLLGQALNYGTVFINAFGGDTDPFTGIDSPIEFQKKLQERLNKLIR